MNDNKKKNALPVRRVTSTVALLGCLLINTNAGAIPIGDFNWSEHTDSECDSGLCGAFFSVDNFSDDPFLSLGPPGDSFFNVSVELLTSAGLLLAPLILGDIAPGAGQSIDDLSGATLASAALTFTFGLPGSIQLLDEFGNIVTSLTGPGSALIDYTAAVVPVPEPSTLLCCVSGLVALAYERRTKRRNRASGPPDRTLAA